MEIQQDSNNAEEIRYRGLRAVESPSVKQRRASIPNKSQLQWENFG